MPILAILVGLGSLVCWIMTLVAIFKNSNIGLGILGIFCPLFAFIFGWVKSSEWGIRGLMVVWTILFVLTLVMRFMAPMHG